MSLIYICMLYLSCVRIHEEKNLIYSLVSQNFMLNQGPYKLVSQYPLPPNLGPKYTPYFHVFFCSSFIFRNSIQRSDQKQQIQRPQCELVIPRLCGIGLGQKMKYSRISLSRTLGFSNLRPIIKREAVVVSLGFALL